MAFSSTMAEALRLTRAGSLAEATALIQSSFGTGSTAPASSSRLSDGEVIDLANDHGIWRAGGPATSAVADEPIAMAGTTNILAGGAMFDEHVHRGPHGSMSYKLYQPARVTPGMPLVVMLHGCTQSPEDFARGTGMNHLADELGFLVAYPRQSQRANPQKCWNWFKRGDQQRDRGEPALIAGVTRDVIARHAIDEGRVYVAGLSAGGAAAAIMAAEYPDLYMAAGIHSGLACGAARDLPSALAAMKHGGAASSSKHDQEFVPVITFHGDDDLTVHKVNSEQIIAAASAAAGVPLEMRVVEGTSSSGRRFTRRLGVDKSGSVLIEQWTIHGSGHAWSGGDKAGSYTDPSGPGASREMMRFFLDTKRR